MQNYHNSNSKNLSSSLNNFKYAVLKSISFDFIKFSRNSRVLYLGEGNFSFSLSIASEIKNLRSNFIATNLLHYKKWSLEALKNASKLNNLNAVVLHSINATKIHEKFKNQQFDLIVFQFPNTGSRIPCHGRNPNHILVRKFLKSAKELIHNRGYICITTINSPHYDGVFSMKDAAEWANLNPPITYPFYPENFKLYNHVNTLNEEESALTKDDKYITFVFQNKKLDHK